jgi:drug/metabolite transporter (DMT)-like permease
MNRAGLIRLILLSMIWGGSFLLLRVAAPEFGPFPLIFVRVAAAALVLLPILSVRENRESFRRVWGKIGVVGILNSSVPFSLLAFSTLRLEAGFTSLINATTPIFAAVVGAVWFGARLRRINILGLCVALAGVALLSWDRMEFKEGGAGWAVVAALLAALSYGVSANLSKRWLKGLNPRMVAAGNMTLAGISMAPLGLIFWPEEAPSATTWACALALAVVCTAGAYLLFFRLLEDAGALGATSVTFLIPVFAVIWGVWLLDERLDARLFAGMAVTLFGTALTIGLIGGGMK